ncbi:DUF1801 domain-containing protein [Flavihumibacter sp. R14]|nr:DUF1801 domain-containing protein [Flavihumibacter soli]
MSKLNGTVKDDKVTGFIRKLEPGFATLIEEIRQAILESDAEISEQIKWNSPSFFYTGDMVAFDPKEYKRDIVVVNVRKNEALLVFPTGIVIEDENGLLEGNYADGRRIVKFKTLEDFRNRKDDLKAVIRNWLDKVEKR